MLLSGRTLSFVGLLWLLVARVAAQVPNDNLENRRLLAPEEVITSSTVGCTVQRACVDERLTGKCIEYHNDQWFEFRPPADGTYYVNLGGQRCRDVRGVQLVVLTGTPCQPATYRILSCTSFGTQDDLFVALPKLRAGQPYLLDVDGYLHDFCSFTLQVSGHARGLPAGPSPAAPADRPGRERVVSLSWHVPDSLTQATRCRVLRREAHEFRAKEIATVPLSRDSYGQRRADYTLTDTLPGVGRYLYQIVAESDPAQPTETAAPPTLLQQRWASYSGLTPPGDLTHDLPRATATEAAFLVLPLSRYPRGADLTVIVSDPATGRVLSRLPLPAFPPKANRERLYAEPWRTGGLSRVAVAITCYPPGGAAFTERFLLPLTGPVGPAVPLSD